MNEADEKMTKTISIANGEETKKQQSANMVPFYKLFSFADSIDKFLMIVGAVAAASSGLRMPLLTVIFGEMADSLGKNQNGNDVVPVVSKVCLKFLYLGVAAGVAGFLQMACWMVTGERQAARIRNLYLKAILHQEIAFFDKETSTGEVVERDVWRHCPDTKCYGRKGTKVGNFIQLVSTLIGGFVIAFTKGWLLTLVLVSSAPPLVIASAVMSFIISKRETNLHDANAKATSIVEQTISSLRTVASFTGEKQALAEYRKSLREAYRSGLDQGLATGLGLGIAGFLVNFSYAFSIWFGVRMIAAKKNTGGEVLCILTIVAAASMSLGQASPCIAAFAAGRAAAFKMFETINMKPKIDAHDTSGKILDDIRGDIKFRNIYFSYPARPDQLIFSGFCLSIPSGSTAALVGHSGSGKSTLISLIERFYDPQGGEILIDGTNLKDFQLKWIREKIGLVSQEPVLFTTSIKENIAYGKDGATVEDIKAAAELANAANFIDKLPKGLDTMVGEHGIQLSGGQKQRVAIARAILRNPRILLLDEATSALDAESERIVQEALDRIMVNRTTVIVAHRLSTVRNADMIAVIHHGKIVEKGTHFELIGDPQGAYCQLIRLQEVNRHDEHSVSDKDKLDVTLDYSRPSSQRIFLARSQSQGSSSLGNSSRRLLPESFDLSIGLAASENTSVKHASAPQNSLEKLLKSPICRLAYLNKPEVPVLLFGSIFAVVNGAVRPIFGTLLSYAIKAFYEQPDKLKKESQFWTLMFLLLGVAPLVANPAMTYFFGVAGCKLIRRIRSMCFEKVVHMEISWFDEPEHSSGIISAKLSADAANLRALVGDALAITVQNASSIVVGLVIAFKASWQLAFIILALLPLIGLRGFADKKYLKGFTADAKVTYEEASQIASDAVGSMRTIASFSAEGKVMELYKKKSEGATKTGVRQGLISGISFGLSNMLVLFAYASSFYAGARLIKAGKTTFSDVFLVFYALAMTAMALSNSAAIAPDSRKAKKAANSVLSLLDSKSNIDSSDESGFIIESVKGEIELRNVCFRYPTRRDVQIFQDLCLTIQSGQILALVGESGSGKSTVISLLQRFYDPESGHILLDGFEIEKLKLKWLRQQMGLVSQEPVLFNDTIRANIAYGKEGNAAEAEVIEAAELANAHNFISGLEQGYDTIVGERGIQLSGGQKQRVAIARAIVKNPKILLLDEATSALDAQSERIVQDALDQVMANRTTVVVAHRLSTIKGADVIAVVTNGAIVEQGMHETLVNIKDGFYASVVNHMSNSYNNS